MAENNTEKVPHEQISRKKEDQSGAVAWIHWIYTIMVRPLVGGIVKGVGTIIGTVLLRYYVLGPIVRYY